MYDITPEFTHTQISIFLKTTPSNAILKGAAGGKDVAFKTAKQVRQKAENDAKPTQESF
jgi:hypothetical protein